MNAVLKTSDFLYSLPILVMAAWACLVLLVDALGRARSSRLDPLAIAGILLSLTSCIWSWISHPDQMTDVFGGMLIVDRYALFFDSLFLFAALLTILLSGSYLREHRFAFGEFHSLILLATTGMMIMIHAGDFIVLVIGLETMSLGIYALVASWKGNKKSAEGGLKYFLMGAVASALLLYGIALIYGATGQTNLLALAQKSAAMAGSRLYLFGMLLVLGAMAFKVALVPFHGWTPDAYEGAPTTVTGFMAAAVKAAGFGILLRVFSTVFGADVFVDSWSDIFSWLAILTMTLGNLAALRQSNIKRMLAYSSIAHAGYIMVGVIAAGVLGAQQSAPVLYYLLAYTFTTLGAFGIIAWVGRRNNERVNLAQWSGLGSQHPIAAAAMTLFLLSLGGVPPTAGFFAKFYLFSAALAHQDLLPLVIIAVLNSVVSFFYYLRPIVAIYFQEEAAAPTAIPLVSPQTGASSTALVIAVLFVLALGIIPTYYLEWANQSVSLLSGR